MTPYYPATKGPIGRLPGCFQLQEFLPYLKDLTFEIFEIDNENGSEKLIAFASEQDLEAFERSSGVLLARSELVMTGPALTESAFESEATKAARLQTDRLWSLAKRPAVANLFGLDRTPTPELAFYLAPCNEHTRPALLALGIVSDLFSDARDTAAVLRNLRAAPELFNAVLCLWKSNGMYPWEEDLFEAREWLLRADRALIALQDEPARPSIALAIAEIDKLTLTRGGGR
jgi:hypothetical protein